MSAVDKPHKVHGLAASSSCLFIAKHYDSGLIILPRSWDLENWTAALQYFLALEKKSLPPPVFAFPTLERIYEPVRQEPGALHQRLSTQFQLLHHKAACFVVTHREALTQKTLPPDDYEKTILNLKRGAWFSREKLIRSLLEMGFHQDDLAEDRGFFSVRGHLVDVFSPYEDAPWRIEFFGDEIVSIRSFDTGSQRSISEADEINLLPTREVVLTEEALKKGRGIIRDLSDERAFDRSDRDRLLQDLENHRELFEPRWLLPAFAGKHALCSLNDYLNPKWPTIFIDPELSAKESAEFLKQEDQDFKHLDRIAFSPEKLRAPLIEVNKEIDSELWSRVGTSGFSYQTLDFSELYQKLRKAQGFQPLVTMIRDFKERGWNITYVGQSEKRTEALQESLEDLVKDITWTKGPALEGFSSETFSRVYLSEKDVFGARKKRRVLSSKSTEEFLRQFSDLKNGDFIIHEDHGVAVFRGLQKLEIQGAVSEFLHLEFADQDKLYLPIYRVDKITRYAREGYAKPRLDKLGGTAFEKRRARIRKDILAVAHELLQISAARKLQKTERNSSIDEEVYGQFSNDFAYDLTPDQERAIREIENDLLQSTYPMDRLICGDVGFGKTEVALRAAALCLLQGKQVAVLAPTTILVEQHYQTFRRRFEKFKFGIGHLSRFMKAPEQKKVVALCKAGEVQLVIGTHRLLQQDVTFKNLGLLIIDEEQRFGVKHKERLKKLRSTVDVLTLSATPIPRTLQMSVVGIRDLSLIATPPDTREAVKTFIAAYEDSLIRKACLREFERGGQILFVHNRVQTIDGVAERLRKLLPELKIVVAHGQMEENLIEKRMIEFIDQKADLLLATTIIENGLDIPNANTLFVDHSERFGLSDLYQLRGRVGRGHRSSFAYFLIHENTELTPEASKRLQVIQSCTELGSGYNVATHDMEIRGSGNLLGEEQSGVIAEVGLELYTQMLEETLAELKHLDPKEPLPELNAGYTSYIPETYIPDASIRIITYKRLNKVMSSAELLSLEEELLDRFGLFPKEVENLCQLTRLRCLAYTLKAQTIDCYPGRLAILLLPSTPLPPEKILKMVGKEFVLDPKGRISYTYPSAMKDASLINKDAKFKDHPDLYDFAICRKFLQKLCEMAGIPMHDV